MHPTSKGAVGHYVAIAKLVRFGLPVFQGYTDVDGVDLVIDVANPEEEPRLLSLQVKSVSSLADRGFRIPRSPARADYYALVETNGVEGTEKLWLIRAEDVQLRAAAESKTKDTIQDLIWKPKSREWLDGFELRANSSDEQPPEAHSPHPHPLFKNWTKRKFHAGRVGKVGEALATAWLIANGCDVYPTTADQKGVDLVAACELGVRFIQVKYATKGASFRNVRIPDGVPRDQFVLLLICHEPRSYYVCLPHELPPGKS
jgi:hypothetical protein